MLQRRHIASPVLIHNSLILSLVIRRIEMENLVEAVPARVDLQRVGEHDKYRDSKLPDGDEERGRGVHCDDIRAHLEHV
jgi:hypothetical protein